MTGLTASAVTVDSYFTDERRLLRVTSVSGTSALCEDTSDPAVTVEISVADLKKMRRVEVNGDG